MILSQYNCTWCRRPGPKSIPMDDIFVFDDTKCDNNSSIRAPAISSFVLRRAARFLEIGDNSVSFYLLANGGFEVSATVYCFIFLHLWFLTTVRISSREYFLFSIHSFTIFLSS
jgi:hypothetical protein